MITIIFISSILYQSPLQWWWQKTASQLQSKEGFVQKVSIQRNQWSWLFESWQCGSPLLRYASHVPTSEKNIECCFLSSAQSSDEHSSLLTRWSNIFYIVTTLQTWKSRNSNRRIIASKRWSTESLEHEKQHFDELHPKHCSCLLKDDFFRLQAKHLTLSRLIRWRHSMKRWTI